MRRLPFLFALLASSAAAHAGEVPLYAPVPDWVVPAPAIDVAGLNDGSPATLVFDSQQRLRKDGTHSYLEIASRATTTQALNQIGTVALPWMPDKGDLTIHRVDILRGAERIDVLKSGERFTVLRREQGMESLVVTGMLTATMNVKGLQLGDTLRVAFSIQKREPALKDHLETVSLTPAAPYRAQFGRARVLWPQDAKVRWKGYLEGLKPVMATVGTDQEMTIALPLAKQPDLPGDLPERFNRPAIVEVSDFADWEDVSRTLAPLYATDGLIAPGSALATEVKALIATKDPLQRTERALEFVQDKIRYLAVSLDGGNLTPQSPAKTWELRYGDCKAKTLMLLALLRGAGIEAEAVAASMQTNGLVAARLPGAAAFDHVLVRAVVNGESLWLDGTGAGARLADIRDTPPFGQVLPLRTAGAGLMPLVVRADVRPRRVIDVTYDQRAGVDFPTLYAIKIGIRGAGAQMLNAAAGQATAEQKREMIQGVVAQELGEVQMSDFALGYDPATATASISANGLMTTRWRREERRYRQPLDRAIGLIQFAPDRSRPAWRDVPVATGGPDSLLVRTLVKLPTGVTGFALEGDQTLSGTVAGRQVARTSSLSGSTVTIEDRIDAVGMEIAPAQIAGERAKIAAAQGRLLRLVAPEVMPRRAAAVRAGRVDGRFKAIDAVFGKAITAAIAADPEDRTGYESRASFRAGIYDFKGALTDLTSAIAIGETASLLWTRGELYEATGDRNAAINDFAAAAALDPTQDGVVARQAGLMALAGKVDEALALLDAKIAAGGEGRFSAIQAKATILAERGDGAAGVALLDAAILEKPGTPGLLNARCWLKGTSNLALDSALKDCTKSIELSETASAALDSRALVYYRMGRMEDAMADADAALAIAPNASATMFLRGVIGARMGRKDQAAEDLSDARLMDPQIDATYKRYGIVL